MKNTFKGLLALSLMTSLCSSCSSQNAGDTEKEEPQELEVEEEYDVQMEEGEVGGGL